jgi:hypothetical protein
MERTFTDVGQRVESQPEWTQGSVIPRRGSTSGRTTAAIGEELARGAGALQGAVKQGAVAIGHEMQDRGEEIIAYTRRQPVRALLAAAGLGLVIGLGLTLALGARAERRQSGWLSQLSHLSHRNARRSLLGRPTGHGWRSVLRLE